MSKPFDLGASRRQRDGYGEKELIITDADGVVEFKAAVAPELPAETLDAGADGKMALALRCLFIDEADAVVFMRDFSPSVVDLAALMKGLYGQTELGEALASGSSSIADGTK